MSNTADTHYLEIVKETEECVHRVYPISKHLKKTVKEEY